MLKELAGFSVAIDILSSIFPLNNLADNKDLNSFSKSFKWECILKFISKFLLFSDFISIVISPSSDVRADCPNPVIDCNMDVNLQKRRAYSNFLTHIFLKLNGTQQ